MKTLEEKKEIIQQFTEMINQMDIEDEQYKSEKKSLSESLDSVKEKIDAYNDFNPLYKYLFCFGCGFIVGISILFFILSIFYQK